MLQLKIKNILQSFRKVFAIKKYLFIGISVFLFMFAFSVMIPHKSALSFVFGSPLFSWLEKIKIAFLSLGGFATNFTLFSQIMMVLISAFAAVNVAFLLYYYSKRLELLRSGSIYVDASKHGLLSVGGIALSFIGVGCSACGSVLLSSFLGLGLTSSIFGWLPFGGKEISMLALALLAFSTFVISQKIQSPAVCHQK